jgi:hypothetical protein
MPNRRSPSQTLIAFALNRELLQALDDARAKTGASRSAFIRQALVAQIRDHHQPVRESWIQAQVRAPDQHRYVSPEIPAKPPGKAPDAVFHPRRATVSSAKKVARRPARP